MNLVALHYAMLSIHCNSIAVYAQRQKAVCLLLAQKQETIIGEIYATVILPIYVQAG